MLNKKRILPFETSIDEKLPTKKLRIYCECQITTKSSKKMECEDKTNDLISTSLIEQMRPINLDDYFGQSHVIGLGTVLRQLLEKKQIFSLILWGPPGCGKTSLANIIASISKDLSDKKVNFIKLSAINSGIQIIKDLVETANKEKSNNHSRTIVFMSEIHRFNKLQQDIFLPHIESGTFILIGVTRENPSCSLNSALLSRCRIYQLNKLTESDIKNILARTIALLNQNINSNDESTSHQSTKYSFEPNCIEWLAKMCDGNAKIGLNTLELAIQSLQIELIDHLMKRSITLEDVRMNFEKACSIIPDKKTDLNHDLISAMHKSIRANEANAALYWLARLMATGEDPVYIGKRLIRIASDIGTLDSDALDTAVHAMHGCQMIGMPECDVLLAQCVIYLCRAQKLDVDLNMQLI